MLVITSMFYVQTADSGWLYGFIRRYAQLADSRLCVVRCTGFFSHTGARGAPRRAGTAVRNGNDADVIYYVNRTNYL